MRDKGRGSSGKEQGGKKKPKLRRGKERETVLRINLSLNERGKKILTMEKKAKGRREEEEELVQRQLECLSV